ncbi:O-methyltransferase, partial [Shewanella sp. MBTL60-112-B2]|uniref:O-methyltransferase n=1 Tax=Shewanella sp. MBTL60-112-B2 TaxID=2815917 RepID=UPI001C81E454
MASGDVINYSVRPAKFVERKVIRDMLINLNRFVPISDYKYIGFGSKYFADFSLFHKTLHINDMVSIEGDVENHEKYFFNKPFECIDVIMGMSNDALPKIEYNKKFIPWLDYDFGIDITMLNDVGILIENLVSGTVVMTSYNSIAHKIGKLREEYNDEDSSHKELLIKKLKDLVSDDYIP